VSVHKRCLTGLFAYCLVNLAFGHTTFFFDFFLYDIQTNVRIICYWWGKSFSYVQGGFSIPLSGF